VTGRRLFLQQIAALILSPALARAQGSEPYGQGLLWRVGIGDAPPSHLFGTLHSGDARVLERARTLQDLLAGARVFMPELVTDADAVNTFMAASTSGGDDLPRLVGRKHWPRVAQTLTLHGIDARMQSRLRPWAALVTLLQPLGPAQTTLDELLIRNAQALNRPVQPIEQVQEQIDALATLPAATQIALLIDTARRHDTLQAGVAPMIEAWLAGDIDELARINTRLIGDDPALRRHAQRLMNALLTQRNPRFVQRLLPEIRQGGVFAAFGAAHLTGHDGVLARLHDAGCSIEKVV
jgi:uncharacterized protein YbaP (TraB family)